MSNPTVTLSMFLTANGGPLQQNVNYPLPLTQNATSSGDSYTISLNSGDNTVNLPSPVVGTTVAVVIYAPAGTITIKGAAGDTGFAVSTGGLFVLPTGTLNSFIVNSSVASNPCSFIWI